MNNIFVEGDAVTRSFSHVPPTHFIIKIQPFSSVTLEKNEFGDFEAGRYKWKLVLYPKGNKGKNVKDHISLYVSIADTSSLKSGWDVCIIFRLFLLDQKKDKFLVVQDVVGKERRFYGLKLEWGFDRFISLEDFNDASNGYLVDDTCVFGAEVFVKERNIAKGECISMIKNPTSIKHLWKIENFSQLNTNYKESELFTAGNHRWKINLYPKGNQNGGSHLSMYLVMADLSTITPGFKIYADFTIQIQDQKEANHITNKDVEPIWFSASLKDWGWPRFVSLSDLNDPGNGYLVNDVFIVEAEVTVLGISKAM